MSNIPCVGDELGDGNLHCIKVQLSETQPEQSRCSVNNCEINEGIQKEKSD